METEKNIIKHSISISELDHENKKLTEVLHKLGFKTEKPTTCIVVSGIRKCGLVERSNVNGNERIYIQDKLFTSIYYTKFPPKIYKIEKHGDSVTYNRRGTYWIEKVTVVHPNIKKIVLERGYNELKEVEIIRSAIHDKIIYLQSVHATYDERKIAEEVITLCYRDLYIQTLKKHLVSPYIMGLRESSYPDIVKQTHTTEAPLTHEIMTLPNDLQNCDVDELEKVFRDNADYSN